MAGTTVKSTTTTTAAADEVALLLHQVSLPAARRDYELRSSSPAPRAPPRAATSSSQLVSRAFQNARAMSFNATAHRRTSKGNDGGEGGEDDDDDDDVPFVISNKRVFFSGPLSGPGPGMAAHHPVVVRRAPATAREPPAREREPVREREPASAREPARVDRDTGDNGGAIPSGPPGRDRIARAGSASIVSSDARGRSGRIAYPGPAPRRALSGDLRERKASSSFNSKNRPRSSELARDLMRTSSSSWSREDPHARSGVTTVAREVSGARDVARAVSVAKDVARACEDEPKVEEKKRGESRRRPTASIAWDSLNESQANSPQHELAAIPFQWEEAPGKPLAATRVREDPLQPAAARLATPLGQDLRAQSHRFYSRSTAQCEVPARKSSFDSASAHLISEVVSSIDLVAPAAAKFLVESWVSPTAAPEAHVAVPFQWEEAPGVPLKPDVEEEFASKSMTPVVPLQLPPRLASPAPPAMSKEELRGRMRTRSMSGPLAAYYPHASPARRRQLQHSPVPQRRSCSPSKRSISPSRIQAIAQHFASSHRKREASLETEFRDSNGSGDGARSATLTFLPDAIGRSPQRYNLSPSQRSVSPSRRIHALAKQLTCKIRPNPSKPHVPIFVKSPHGDPWSPPALNLQDELHLSGPTSSSSNSDLDAASSQQTPVSESLSKSLSRVSYESFEHSFAHRAANATATTTNDDGLLASPPARSSSADDVKEDRMMMVAMRSASPPESPYLGQCGDAHGGDGGDCDGDGAFKESRRGEGTVNAVVKLCRTGSSALRKKTTTTTSLSQSSGHDLWTPTLASYFRCLEAANLISNPGARARPSITSNSEQEGSVDATESQMQQTRLPYTMPNSTSSSAEQNLLWKDYCESPRNGEFRTTCLGVKISHPPAGANMFLSKGGQQQQQQGQQRGFRSETSSVAWPNSCSEDGFRSPAYAATLELLSPSAELFRKTKKKRMAGPGSGASRGIKLVLPSTRRRMQIMEAVCTSLKRALYKCAKRCYRKTCSSPPLSSVPSRH